MKIRFVWLLFIFCLASCGVSSIGQRQITTLSSTPLLGSFGSLDNDLLQVQFKEVGIAQLKEKVRLGKEYKLFTNRGVKRYNSDIVEEEQKIRKVDSIGLRPGYFKFGITDKVGLIDAINDPLNQELKKYLASTKENHILTGIEIYFTPEITSQIQEAVEVYLINDKKSSNSLELLFKNGKNKIINFNEGRPLSFHFMSLCWRESYKGKAEIAAFREIDSSCPGTTKRNPDSLDSKDIFEKMDR